jgi:hypothetical protein
MRAVIIALILLLGSVVLLGPVSFTTTTVQAQTSDACKKCAEQQTACKKNYAAKTCANEYNICMKGCKK